MVDLEADLREALDAGSDGPTLRVPAHWEGVPGTAFGGFVAAATLTAASARASHARPLSFFMRYHRPAPLDEPLGLRVESERSGRSVETLAGRLLRGDRLLATFSAAFGRVSEAPLASQAVAPMPAIAKARPVWEFLEAAGKSPPVMMRRVGFRGELDDVPEAEARQGWHLRAQWPASASRDPAIQAAVALMAIDCFVAPATIRANGLETHEDWPVVVPSLDLTAWFYAPPPGRDGRGDGAGAADADDWLAARVSVPVSRDGYAVGRTQVWTRDVLVAEGMSQVALVPVPATAAAPR